jgi:arsenate reductase (glutaredoxin)
MKVTVYGIRNCDTIKNTLAWLDQHGVEYHFHDYKREGVPSERLAAWAKVVGWERLANRRGPTWRKIPEDAKTGLDEARALKLLETNSSAIKRPVVECGKKLLVGFDADEYDRAFDQ